MKPQWTTEGAVYRAHLRNEVRQAQIGWQTETVEYALKQVFDELRAGLLTGRGHADEVRPDQSADHSAAASSQHFSGCCAKQQWNSLPAGVREVDRVAVDVAVPVAGHDQVHVARERVFGQEGGCAQVGLTIAVEHLIVLFIIKCFDSPLIFFDFF
jgi:hypothetical protein